MHVARQIADAVVQTLRDRVPGLAAAYRYGTPPSGRRRFPVAVVLPGEATVDTQLSGNRRSGRVQTRTLQLGVAIRDLTTDDGVDYATRLANLSVDVERALAGWDALPIDDVQLTGDSGVQDIEEDGEPGVHAGCALNFEIRFFTVEGASDAFVEPNH